MGGTGGGPGWAQTKSGSLQQLCEGETGQGGGRCQHHPHREEKTEKGLYSIRHHYCALPNETNRVY